MTLVTFTIVCWKHATFQVHLFTWKGERIKLAIQVTDWLTDCNTQIISISLYLSPFSLCGSILLQFTFFRCDCHWYTFDETAHAVSSSLSLLLLLFTGHSECNLVTFSIQLKAERRINVNRWSVKYVNVLNGSPRNFPTTMKDWAYIAHWSTWSSFLHFSSSPSFFFLPSHC